MPTSSPPYTYTLHPAVLLHWSGWDDEYVVYDEASGQTYQFDALRAFVLDALIEQPQSLDSILERLASVEALDKSENLAELISNILRELATYGLLRAPAP